MNPMHLFRLIRITFFMRASISKCLRHGFSAVAFVVGTFTLAAEPNGPAADKGSPPALAPVLQASVDHHIASGLVGLVANKDKVLDLEAVGLSSLTTKAPMQKDSFFWIASMTKSFTAAAFMMLVDEGKADISDPVEKYLPEFKGQKVMENGDPKRLHPPQHPITIREVLSHTSGLILAGDRSLKHTYSLRDDVVQFAAAPLRQEPGTKFEYNNSGINTAARIIEVLSGMSYADFLHKRLLDPLGMTDTTFWPTAEQAKRLANSDKFTEDKSGLEDIEFSKGLTPALIEKLGHGVLVPHEVLENFGGGKIPEYAAHFADGAGGLFSTTGDVAKFCQMLLNGGSFQGKRLLSENAIKQLGSNQTGDVPVNPQEGYGLGMFVKKRNDEGPSVGSFGHRGARRTVMWIDQKNQLVMILMVQRMDMSGEQQKELYSTFMKAAVEKYGSQGGTP